MGAAFWVFFHQQNAVLVGENELAQALESETWQERVAALRIIEQKQMEISDFPAYKALLSSPHIPERYWLARALGTSRRPETYTVLLRLLEDPHPNVVSMAFYALGRRGDRRAISEIVRRIEISRHWYNQWHAYKALRMLGWRQSRSE
jgi:HEAT repeat protein